VAAFFSFLRLAWFVGRAEPQCAPFPFLEPALSLVPVSPRQRLAQVRPEQLARMEVDSLAVV
jgi:hypothetical protein